MGMPKLVHSDLSWIAEAVLDAHKSPPGEFKGFIVEGKLRIGKTVLVIKVLRDIYMGLNPEATAEEAYEWALQQIHFDLNQFLTCIRDKQREIREALPKIDWTKRLPGVALDDASLYAGTDLYFKDQSLYAAFQDAMTTVGSAASGVFITAPSHMALTKCLREYYSYYVVKITKEDVWERRAEVMEWYTTPRTRTPRLRGIATDMFTAHVPNAIYAKYLKPRLEKGEEAVEGALAASRARTIEPIKEVAEEVLGQTPPPKKGKRERKPRPPELAHVKILH